MSILPYRMEIVEDRDEGGYVVSFPELPGYITCGEAVESVVANVKEAKREWITAALEEGITIHERMTWRTAPVNSSSAFRKVCIVP